jgi:hypothetical protein
MRQWTVIFTLWLLSVVATGTFVYAQVRLNEPNIISGSDLGFVVEQQEKVVALGHFVVRVNGQWMPVAGSARGQVVPAK